MQTAVVFLILVSRLFFKIVFSSLFLTAQTTSSYFYQMSIPELSTILRIKEKHEGGQSMVDIA